MEAEDASVPAHEEVVKERVAHPDPNQLGQSCAITEQRRYQEEGAGGAAATVNADSGQRETALKERKFGVEILQVPFPHLLILRFHRIEINPPSMMNLLHGSGAAALPALQQTKARCIRVTTMVSDCSILMSPNMPLSQLQDTKSLGSFDHRPLRSARIHL